MGTQYDAWRTNVEEANEEAWNDAVDYVSGQIFEDSERSADVVSIVANADEVLKWISNAVEVPKHHNGALRDLINLVASLRKDVETEMKSYRDARD